MLIDMARERRLWQDAKKKGVLARIETLSKAEEGWYEDNWKAADQASAAFAKEFFTNLPDELYLINPIPSMDSEGIFTLFVDNGVIYVDLDFMPDRKFDYYILDQKTKKEYSEEGCESVETILDLLRMGLKK